MEIEQKTAAEEIPQFTDAKPVAKRGRGFLRPVIFQLAVCAATAAVLWAIGRTSPELYDFALEKLLAAIGR